MLTPLLAPLVRRPLPWLLWALLAAPAAHGMGLAEAHRLALQNDATLRAARAAADVQRERLPLAQAQLLPNVALGASRVYNDLSRTASDFLGRPQRIDEQYPSYNATLSIRQPLYRPALRAGVEQARSVVADAEAVLAAETNRLAERVTAAYLEALLNQDQLELVLKQQQVALRQLDAAEKAWRVGTGIRTDIDEIQARLDLLRADELRARQAHDMARRQLENLTGVSASTLWPLAPERLVLEPPQPSTLAEWQAAAEANSPELAALRARRDAARQEIERARAGHLPTLDAVAQITRSASENVTTPSSSYTNRLIGLQLNVPLYAGGAVDASVRQAVAELTRVEETLEATRRDLGLRVHREFRAVTEGVARIRALEQALRSADQVVTANRRSYEAGTRTVLDVLNAEQQRQSVLRDLAQARYEYLLARVRLVSLSGGDVEGTIAGVDGVLRGAQ
ncbi:MULTISPECIES: TolC family outer membrane protein [unclassified Tepidimonas]|uniref:TolC family outer membrane protein n=1 Tax=unclassified Tepidimonas TaxID=2631705 RepID=UPI003C7D0553